MPDAGQVFRNGLIVGLTLGVLLCMLIAVLAAANDAKLSRVTQAYNAAIQECEKSLPRDQHCKLVGVVDNEAR